MGIDTLAVLVFYLLIGIGVTGAFVPRPKHNRVIWALVALLCVFVWPVAVAYFGTVVLMKSQ